MPFSAEWPGGHFPSHGSLSRCAKRQWWAGPRAIPIFPKCSAPWAASALLWLKGSRRTSRTWVGICDLARRKLLPPSRRRRSDFALECPAEGLFRLIANGIGDLGNGLHRLAQLNLCGFHAPGNQVADGRHADESREAVGEGELHPSLVPSCPGCPPSR